MYQLNYNHLYYFYLTAREGTVAKAAKLLHVTPQTVSGQLVTFENQLGYALFDRVNKRLYLNNKGKLVYQEAQEIFQRGNHLAEMLKTGFESNEQEFVIGLTDAIPKILAYNFISPSMKDKLHTRFVFHEGSFDALLSDMAINKVDLILADQSLATDSQINAHSYFLGDSHISFFCQMALHEKLTQDFPSSLTKQNLLLPSNKSGIKRELTTWFESQQIYPHVVAEFDDSALLKLFGREGFGVFASPSVITPHVEQHFQVKHFGDISEITERYYAVIGKNRMNNEIAQSIIKNAIEFLSS